MQIKNSKFLVTGGAGFIGSHLVDRLLSGGASVVVLDNLSTGKQENVARFELNKRFRMIVGDIRDRETCEIAAAGCDCVLHEAALGSVPRSIADPLRTFEVNAAGFANVLAAARNSGCRRFIYASSSSVYGDSPAAAKSEESLGEPLSPYAVTKRTNELLALNFSRVYGLETIGLRYFNVFGPRQDPAGPYAAVIPKFIAALRHHEPPVIYGDGSNSRDFTYVDNVVAANILAATTENADALGQVYNIACGRSVSLNELFSTLREMLAENDPAVTGIEARHEAPRRGDIAHSRANIDKAERLLNYRPEVSWREGLLRTL